MNWYKYNNNITLVKEQSCISLILLIHHLREMMTVWRKLMKSRFVKEMEVLYICNGFYAEVFKDSYDWSFYKLFETTRYLSFIKISM